MADTISHVWQTVEQAAVTLNCSTRTIARRIAGGTMESRVDENGRRLVLVQTVTQADGTSTPAEQDYDDVSPPTAIATPVQSDALAISEKSAGGMLAVLQSTIDAAREDAHVARTGARWAWAGIAALALALAGSTLYLNQWATRAEVKATILEKQVTDTKAELGQTRNELLAAHAARAVAEQEKSIAIVRVKESETKLTELNKPAATPAASTVAMEAPAAPAAPATRTAVQLKAFADILDRADR